MRKPTTWVILLLQFPLIALAAVTFTNVDYYIQAGQSFRITWTNNRGPVTVTLMHGPDVNLQPVLIVTSDDEGQEFTWTPPLDLPSNTYELKIEDSGSTDYSSRFQYLGVDGAPIPEIGYITAAQSTTSPPAPTSTPTPTPPDAPTSTPPPSATPTAASVAPAPTGSPALSTAAKAAVASVVSVVVLASLLLLGYLAYRRRRRKRNPHAHVCAELDETPSLPDETRKEGPDGRVELGTDRGDGFDVMGRKGRAGAQELDSETDRAELDASGGGDGVGVGPGGNNRGLGGDRGSPGGEREGEGKREWFGYWHGGGGEGEPETRLAGLGSDVKYLR